MHCHLKPPIRHCFDLGIITRPDLRIHNTSAKLAGKSFPRTSCSDMSSKELNLYYNSHLQPYVVNTDYSFICCVRICIYALQMCVCVCVCVWKKMRICCFIASAGSGCPVMTRSGIMLEYCIIA